MVEERRAASISAPRCVVKRTSDRCAARNAIVTTLYRKREGCHIIGERKSFAKKQVTFIFHAPRAPQRDGLVQRLEAEVRESLRGVADWGVD